MSIFKKRANIKILVAVIAVIFSLAAAFTGTFAWFSLNSTVESGGMSVKAKTTDVELNCLEYKYSVAQDKVVLLGGNNARILSLNQYDMVFTSLNKYNSLYLQLLLKGKENHPLNSSGTISLTLEREVDDTETMPLSKLPGTFSSVTKYSVKGHSNANYVFGDEAQTWNNLQTAFYQQDKDVNPSGTLVTQSFTTKTGSSYTKANSISLSYSYSSADFYDDSLIIFLYINYDKTLVESFIDEQDYDPQAIGGSINHILENDLKTLHIDI